MTGVPPRDIYGGDCDEPKAGSWFELKYVSEQKPRVFVCVCV